jgi:hypothetical protein
MENPSSGFLTAESAGILFAALLEADPGDGPGRAFSKAE